MVKETFKKLLERAEINYKEVTVKKNNNTVLEGIQLFTTEEGGIFPTVYRNFWEEERDEAVMLSKLFELREEQKKMKKPDNIKEMFENDNWVGSRIRIAVRNIELNKEDEETYTKKCKKPFDDLETYLYLKLKDEDMEELGIPSVDSNASITIRKDWLNTYKYDLKWLEKKAMVNCKKEIEIKSMYETLTELLPFDDGSILNDNGMMWVISNKSKTKGAISAICFKKEIEDFCIENNIRVYAILPSSIHECLLVKISEFYSKEELENMVREVNETSVEPNEILGYKAYIGTIDE